jgi:hypothetical protein
MKWIRGFRPTRDMPVLQESTHDERELTRYLLGQLAEEDADRLDELAIVDDDMAWRVRAVENDLVDAYVRGALDTESRQRFETHYLATPKRRAKVRFAARFARAVDAFGPPQQRPERRGRPSASPPPRRSSWVWNAGYAAAAVLLAIVCGLLLMRDLRLGRELRESEQQRATLDRRARQLEDQLARERAAAADVEAAATIDQARAGAKDPAARPSTSPSTLTGSGVEAEAKASASPVAAVALVLWPQTRGATGSGSAAGAAAPALRVSPGVDRVTLELQLDAPDFVRYSATLKESATGRIVWHGERLSASSPAPDAPPIVSITVPANLLTSQPYVVELTGYAAGAAGAAAGDVIGSYAFQVARR